MIRPVPSLLFAVIGHPVAHSLSPAMMNAAFVELGIEASYLAFDIDTPEEDLSTLHRLGVSGLSVTLPHKKIAFDLVKPSDKTAVAIGAVNTLKRTETGWEGRNTDWIGAVKAIERITPIHDSRALVLGAGGAARAVVYGLTRRGASVTIVNRGRERGLDLAEEFGCAFMTLDEISRPGAGEAFDLVAQCTSVGLDLTNPLDLVPADFFHDRMTVMDSVYKPLLTPFIESALKKGATIVPGHDMLLFQGVAQLEWWLERPVPDSCVAAMHASLVEILGPDHHDDH